MPRCLPSWLPVLLAGCVGQPPPPPSHDGSGTSAGDDPTVSGPSTLDEGNATTPSTEGVTGTSGLPTSGPDTTSAPGTDTGTETGVGVSTSTGEPAECKSNDECQSNEVCDQEGQCASACPGGWGDGNYAYCLNEWGAVDSQSYCSGTLDAVCVLGDGVSNVQGAFCSNQDCASACDCPPPPATGNATVTCGALTIGDGADDCYLSCANGETCPDDMYCRNNEYCTHAAQPLSMYGNCGNVDAPCAEGDCFTFVGGSYAMCVSTCNDVGRCAPAIPGSNDASACDAVFMNPPGADCHIPCNFDGDCPFSMDCVQGIACLWPL